MSISLSGPRFGTRLWIDPHPMTRNRLERISNASKIGIALARHALAKDGNPKAAVRLFYADELFGQRPGAWANYLGFEYTDGPGTFWSYPPVTETVDAFDKITRPREAKAIILAAHQRLKQRVKGYS